MDDVHRVRRVHARGSAPRLAGEQFVRGQVRYLDDATPPDCLQARFVRAPVAHAAIEAIDVSAARGMPGVRAVLSGAEVRAAIGELVAAPPGSASGTPDAVTVPFLADERVRFWGEPVAVIVADTEHIARAAAEAVEVAYRPLPAVLTVEDAVAPDAPRLHPGLPGNVLFDGAVADGDVDEALTRAHQELAGTVSMGRGSAVPLEPRGCVARWDDAESRLLVRAAVQNPHALRANLAGQLAMAESDIQIIAPALGGGFGFKFIGTPEEPVVCLLAARLRRAVRWVESREESLLIGARDYEADYRVGFDPSGRLHGLAVELRANLGALAATPGIGMPAVAAATFPGPYLLPDFRVRWRAVLSNKGPWNGARGYGKEITTVVLEDALDAVAATLRLDPADVRRRNLLGADRFPHRTATMTIDSGAYERVLDKALALAEYPMIRRRADGQLPSARTRRGIGLAFELTPEGRDPAGGTARGSETATVRLDTSGHATVLTGVTSPGTGSETAIAQLVAERLGIPAQDVRVVQGDTDRTPYGGGSFSSRAVLAGGTAAWQAADRLRGVLLRAAAARFGAEAGEVTVDEGAYRVGGQRVRVADLAREIRAFGSSKAGLGDEQLEATATYMPANLQSVPDTDGRVQQYPTHSNGAYVAEVSVDLDTGCVHVETISATHDCGTVINPRLVDAQIRGAIAMGVGIALMEEETYTSDGQPRSLSFKRYMLPRLDDMPDIRLDHIETPSPFTLLGTKGAGESGVGGTTAAIIAAVRDALGGWRGPVTLPLTPARVLEMLDAHDYGPPHPTPAMAGAR